MTTIALLVVCLAGGLLTVLLQPFGRVRTLVGVAALGCAAVAALGLATGGAVGPFGPVGPFGSADAPIVGGVTIVPSSYAALFVAAGLGVSATLTLLTLGREARSLAPVALAMFGAIGLAFTAMDWSVALVAVAAAAVPAVALALPAQTGTTAPAVVRNELRVASLVVAGALLAAAVTQGPGWASGDARPALGGVYMLLAVGIGVRYGVVPFHAPAARASASGSPLALPLVLAWAPAALSIVAVSWIGSVPSLQGDWLALPATVIVAVGVATLVLGAVGALLHDELREIAIYSIVQDAGFALLAVGSRGDAGEPLRVWLLTFAVAKTALLAWAASVERSFGTGNLSSLAGWARRSPLLAVALVAIVAATIGWPGSPVADARSTLIRLVVPPPFDVLAPLVAVLSLAYYLRPLVVGLLAPSPTVLEGRGDRLWLAAPAPGVAGPSVAPSGADPVAPPGADPSVADPSVADPSGGDPSPAVPSTARDRWREVAARSRVLARQAGRGASRALRSLRLNGGPARSLLVVALAALAVTIAFGPAGRDAARGGIALDAAGATPVSSQGADVPLPSGAVTTPTLPPGYVGP